MNRFVVLVILLPVLGGVYLFQETTITPQEDSFQENSLNAVELRAEVVSFIHQKGSSQAFPSFKKKYQDTTFDQQHNVAHIVGESLYGVDGVDGVVGCDPGFAFGCYHGFFTQAVAGEGLSVVSLMDEACRSVAGNTSSACQHGIGHGIMEFVGNRSLNQALETCLQTTQPDPLAGCTSGVFMEYNVPLKTIDQGSFSTAPREFFDDPYEPCTDIDDQFKLSCYHELPQWWVQVYEYDYRTIGALCISLDDSFSRVCFLGLGKVVAPSAQFDPVVTRVNCEQIRDARGEYLCRASAAWSVALDGGGIEQSRTVCSESIEKYNYECPVDVEK